MTYWTDKAALVTGGSSGLGLAIARALVAAGARVAICGRDVGRLEAAAAGLGDRCQGIAADVTRDSDVAALVAKTVEAYERLDLLVNCAGRSTRGAIETVTAKQFAELLDVNFLSAVRCTQAALPHLIESRGHVVHIGSLASKAASKHLGAYPASKFPLAAYAQQMRLELADQGVSTLLVCPGPIRRDENSPRYEIESAGLPEAASRPGGGVKLNGIDPDWLARRILRAAERRQAEVVVPARARLLFAIAQLSPRLGDWLIRRMTS